MSAKPKESGKPLCFDTMKHFKIWVEAARASHPHPAHSYCEDCTEEYRDRMVIANRCGHPQTIFRRFHGEMVGRRPVEYVNALQLEAIITVTEEPKHV